MEKFETLLRIFNDYATNVEVECFSIDRGRIKEIWKLWNPPHRDPGFFVPDLQVTSAPFVAKPRKLNVSWTKERELELGHIFNEDLTKVTLQTLAFNEMKKGLKINGMVRTPVCSETIDISFNVKGER